MAIAFKGFGFNGSSSNNATATIGNASVAAGDCVIACFGIENTAVSISTVTDTGGSTWTFLATITNSTSKLELWGVLSAVGAMTTITATYTGGTSPYANVCGIYTGVAALGMTATNTGTSTAPSVSLTTQDDNNFAVAGMVHVGTGTFSASVGNFRKDTSGSLNRTALNDNTIATAGTCTNTCTIASAAWAAAAVELRSTVAGSAALTGTVTSSITEANIVAGGKTVILTLTGKQWLPS